MLDLDALARELSHFARIRNWEPLHTPKNLALALAGETGELCALYQWLPADGAPPYARVADEVADVMIYLVRLADAAGVDLGQAVREKMRRNESRFPGWHGNTP